MSRIDGRTGKPKIILDLCGGTGSWSRLYKDAGHDVRLITLPDYDVLTYIPPENVYGILAAPPCTEFSLAKGSKPRDWMGAVAVMAACKSIIWSSCASRSLKFWALENPRGFMRQFLGRPAFTFEQWQFGDPGIKPTDLWGYFNAPRIIVKERPAHLVLKCKDGHSHGKLMASPQCPIDYAHLKLDRAAIRAITPPGFAQSFFLANR